MQAAVFRDLDRAIPVICAETALPARLLPFSSKSAAVSGIFGRPSA